MPPPTLSDPWLSSRKFGIVIDAGSSGSRLQIYSWKDARTVRLELSASDLHSLPLVEKGTKSQDDWQKKAEPGISTFGSNPDGVAEYLEPLLNHAKDQIPPSLHSSTPIFLLATAGMRLLSPEHQSDVLEAACDYIGDHSKFLLDASMKKTNRPLLGTEGTKRCGRSIRIISGEEEGLFGWIAVNYLMNGFAVKHSDHNTSTTYGFLDMGGASTQIAFEPAKNVDSSKGLSDVRLRLLNGEEIRHRVFVTTWLGFGTNQARERYVTQAVTEWEAERHSAAVEISDPCLPKNLVVHQEHYDSSLAEVPVTLTGTGSFQQCLARTTPLLNKGAPCLQDPCLFNGVHVPPIDFSHHRFIGISEYWYSSQHVFGLGGAFDFEKYEKAAETFCGRDWDDILEEHQRNANPHAAPTWHQDVDEARLKLQCFKAAWIVNVLGRGVGIPRTSGSWKEITSGDKTGDLHVDEEKAEKLGLDEGEIRNPIFQSVDSIKGTAVSWTLGKMVLEASKGVPPSSKKDRPIEDPMGPTLTPVEPAPGRLPFGLNFDSIEQHLPTPFRKEALGFSPVMMMLYAIIIFSMFFVLSKLRHRFRSSFRKWRRGSMKRDAFVNEDGLVGGGGSEASPPNTPASLASQQSLLSSRPLAFIYHLASSLRRMLPLSNPRRNSPAAQYIPIHPQSSFSASRNRPIPAPLIFNQLPTPQVNHQEFSTLPLARSSTSNLANGAYLTPIKIVPQVDDKSPLSSGPGSPGHTPLGLNPNGLAALSMSRNSSQVNLTRTIPTPRTASGFSTSSGLSFTTASSSGFRSSTTFTEYD